MKEIIDKAYKIFSMYRVNQPLDVCTNCCMTLNDEGQLASLPVKKITKELLSEYNDSAKPEKTRIEEVKHFLPRYLELISEYNFPSHSAELSLMRLVSFDKNEWKEHELKLLENFSIAFFKQTLHTHPIPSFSDNIDSILIMFWQGEFNIELLLNEWEQTNTLQSVLHFNDLYFRGFTEHNRNELSNSFGDKELSIKLINWIENEKTKLVFKESIEHIILGNFDLQTITLNELNLLYEILSSP